jgi:hypothetical protein
MSILTKNPKKKTKATEAKMRPKRVLLFFCSGVAAMMQYFQVNQSRGLP